MIKRAHTLPTYVRSIDFEALFQRHPPPVEFVEGLYSWSRDQIRAHQERLFADTMKVAWENPFYRRRWSEEGIEPGDIKSLSDLGKLPMVTVYDFKDAIDADPPFGAHQGVSDVLGGEPLKIQSSGGTTGLPRPTFFGPVEWEAQGIQAARALYVQGLGPGDTLQIPVTLSLSNMGWCYFQACYYYLGVIPLTVGTGLVTPSRRQLELMQSWGTTALASFPEYLLHLGVVARDELGFDVSSLPVRLISTYLGPDTQGQLRAALEEMWGCDVFDNYGTHEIGLASFECPAKDGLHFHEDMLVVEVADVDTGEIVSDGRVGNLVATSLYRNHPPLIRYNLMDLIELKDDGQCVCGSNLLRMGHFLGRSDDMVKLRGTNLYPMACLNAVRSSQNTTGEWLCVVDRVGTDTGAARDEMTVLIERTAGPIDEAATVTALEAALRVDLGARVTVELVPEGSLADRTNFGREGKVRRLLDRRPGYERKY